MGLILDPTGAIRSIASSDRLARRSRVVLVANVRGRARASMHETLAPFSFGSHVGIVGFREGEIARGLPDEAVISPSTCFPCASQSPFLGSSFLADSA